MWISNKLVSLLNISKDTVDTLRDELASTRLERDFLKSDLLSTKANFEWLRTRVNSLEVERAQLIQKVYGLNVPVPAILRSPKDPIELNADIFQDVGDDTAKKLGYTVVDKN